MNETSTRAFADVARGLLIAVAFASFGLGIFQASDTAIAETKDAAEAIDETAFSLTIDAGITDAVIDIARITGVITITRDKEQCELDLTST